MQRAELAALFCVSVCRSFSEAFVSTVWCAGVVAVSALVLFGRPLAFPLASVYYDNSDARLQRTARCGSARTKFPELFDIVLQGIWGCGCC